MQYFNNKKIYDKELKHHHIFIGFSDRMIGQYRREKHLQLNSHGLVQYSVLAMPAETAHNHETKSSLHGRFPDQSLVQTPTFSNQ
jgi:hypothetical protein